jgi:hypothetical protein
MRGVGKRRTLLALLVVAAILATAGAAHADSDDALNRRLSGVASGTGIARGDPRCDIEAITFQHFALTIDTVSPRDSSLSIDVCIDTQACPAPTLCQYFGGGTFVLTLPSGTMLNGVLGVSEVLVIPVRAMRFFFTATSGTRGLRGATGTMLLEGTWTPSGQGLFTGTLTTSVTRKG